MIYACGEFKYGEFHAPVIRLSSRRGPSVPLCASSKRVDAQKQTDERYWNIMPGTGAHKRYVTKNAGFEHVTHSAELSDNFRLCAPGLFCQPCCFWDAYNSRAFVRVTETRIETNYPIMCSPFSFTDMISSTYYDKVKSPFERATACTPFHCCCCVELSGQVAASAKHPMCNNCLGGWIVCRTYIVGLKDAQTFCTAVNAARESFKKDERNAPSIQIMS